MKIQCIICGKNAIPKYRVTKEYLKQRKFCSHKCSKKGAIGRPSRKKGRIIIPLEDRFWSKVNKGKPNVCWEWQGAKEVKGYGFIYKLGGGWIKAHRLSYELNKGEVPKELCVCHTCDNPPCVNPKHLWLGTRTQNNQDKLKKGRLGDRKGEMNGRSKLTTRDIMNIIKFRKQGLSQQAIANKFNVSQVNISRIIQGKTWKHFLDV